MISAEYAAGLFDGEGCVTFYQSRGYTNPILVIAISDRWALESMAARWGGRVHHIGSQQKPGHLPIYHWRMFGKPAQAFACDILPHLLIKRIEVEIVLPFLGCYGRQDEKHAARAALKELRASRPRTDEHGLPKGERAAMEDWSIPHPAVDMGTLPAVAS